MNKFSQLFVATLCVLALVSSLSEAQQRQGRQRSSSPRNRQKSKDQCHGKEVDKCYEQLQALGKVDRPADIIKTKEGLDKLCK